MTIKFFTFFFAYGKWCILLENIVYENVVYIIAFLIKVFFTVAGYLKWSNETPASI